MMALPLRIAGEDTMDLWIVLSEENVDRIKLHDPAEMATSTLGDRFANYKVRNVIVGYLDEVDSQEFVRLCRQGEVREALRFVSRGWKFRPAMGDGGSAQRVV